MILDKDGNVVRVREAGICPQCGSRSKDHTTFALFGGNWRRLCNLCAYELDSGSGSPPDVSFGGRV